MNQSYPEAIEFQLDFKYKDAARKALTNVNGKVGRGRCVVLCGSSGCGKSTLLRSVNQLIPQFYEGELKGFCRINGKNTENLQIGEVGKIAASVFQDPRSQFFTLNSSTELAFGLENFGFTNKEIVEKVGKTFADFHLEKLKNRNVFELSSGERQLIAILSARAVDTDLYLLDEPTANLDGEAVERLKNLLCLLKNQGKTMLVSEHRLYYLAGIADEYWFMQKGEIVKRFTKEEMQNMTPEELKLLGLRTNDIAKTEIEVNFDDSKALSACKNNHTIEVRNLTFRYNKNSKEVLKDIKFSASVGEVTGLIGHNGSGKTTLGKILTGLYKQTFGEILFDGVKSGQKKMVENGIFIMQEAEFQFFTNSVMNELYYGMKKDKNNPEVKEKIKELLKKSDLWQCRNQHPFSLSGGQMQKLVLLLAYLSEKRVVVLDEPTAGLDYVSLCHCAELIREMQKNKIVFVITHDIELISKVCTKAIYISKSEIRREFDLAETGEFENLKKTMSSQFCENSDCKEIFAEESENEKFKFIANERKISSEQTSTETDDSYIQSSKKAGSKHTDKSSVSNCGKARFRIDPRPKLFLFLAAMIAGIGTDNSLILCVFAVIALVSLIESKFKVLFSGVFLMGGIFLLYHFAKCVVTAFIISFFPRVIVICYAALLIISERDAPITLAALRKIHIPEKIIMVLSVMLRFFPVLQKDLKMMGESIRTRGFFRSFSEKIRSIPEYMEIMIVPTVFRVIRIAEALSASAETRGIALKNKRDSFISVKMGFTDVALLCLTVVALTVGIII